MLTVQMIKDHLSRSPHNNGAGSAAAASSSASMAASASVVASSSSSISSAASSTSVSSSASSSSESAIDKHAQYAYTLFERARFSDGHNILLLGGFDMRDARKDAELHSNFLSTFVTPNVGVAAAEIEAKKKQESAGFGAILNEKDWMTYLRLFGSFGLVINDAWVLGGIDSEKDFYLLISPFEPAFIWDSAANRVTVFGRELLGLIGFGYKLEVISRFGSGGAKESHFYMFLPTSAKQVAKPLEHYENTVALYDTQNKVMLAIMENALFSNKDHPGNRVAYPQMLDSIRRRGSSSSFFW